MAPHTLVGSVPVAPATSWRRWLTFAGPATLVSVGYMDPGNWATDLEGGSRFGYTLLWVLAASSFMAMFLQHLVARLSLVTGKDLAEACRAYYPRSIVLTLWVLCQAAIVACDLAEVIGSAVALNLLFHIPIAWAAVLTVGDVFLVLLLQNRGVRRLEAVVAALVATIGVCVAYEIAIAGPQWGDVMAGMRPVLHTDQLYVAVAILGATIMPHNLYLHSWMVKTRRVADSSAGKTRAIRESLVSTIIALSLAFLINAGLLVLAADVFHPAGVVVSDLREAHALLVPLLGGSAAAIAFAIALLAAGQSATITATLAGQAVMLGFLGWTAKPATVRILTRLAACLPAVAIIAFVGEQVTVDLLVATQVVLSLQLPFAVIPLVRFTGSRLVMGRFVAGTTVRLAGWVVAGGLVLLNGWMAASAAAHTPWIYLVVAGLGLALALLGFLLVTRIPGQANSAESVGAPAH